MPVGVPNIGMNYFSYNGYDGYMPSEESFGYSDGRRDAFLKADSFQHIDAPYSRQGSRNDFASNPARPVPYAPSGDRNYDARMSPMGQSVFFEVDHLATFTVTHEETHNPEAGVAKLSTMANTSGIWTMKCILAIERNHLIIKEKGTESMLDCFPLPNIYNPFAITKSEKCDVYNNLVVLSVIDNTKRDNQPQMHIFLAGSIPAQDIVDEILNAKAGRPPTSRFNNQLIPPPPSQPAPEPPSFMTAKSSFIAATPDRTLGSSLSGANILKNENSERDGQLLNHCFDDIEKFVARLQKAAESYKELERLKKDKGGKEKRGRQEMEDKLTMSALPPKPQDFVDIFQKFKLSFNLLAKLKGHIHDPNAPELVHFIFTPLSLIYEASRDPTHGNRNLAANVYSPMLTAEAKDLLLNCLTSKEVDLWMSFGEGWTTSREDYKGYVPPYTPRFYNGWHPAPSADDYAPQPVQGIPKIQPSMMGANRVLVAHHEPFMQEKMGPPSQRFNNIPVPSVPDNSNELFLQGLRERGAKFCEVTHYRQKKNTKELTVIKGEILEILDDSRNWWKLKNCRGQVGHAPYTILSQHVSLTPIDNGGNRNILQNSAAGSSMKGDLRYF